MQNRMVNSKQTLRQCISADIRANYGDKPMNLEARFRGSYPYMVCRYLKVLRKLEYTCCRRDQSKYRLVAMFLAQKVKLLDRRKNRLGLKFGIEIPIHRVAPGVRIAHPNVILNGYVGEGCVFHGNNVLGNKRTGDSTSIPRLGKNVDVGIGAMIIGDVKIADDCIIGAGAVVTKSFIEPGAVIVGIPAKTLRG